MNAGHSAGRMAHGWLALAALCALCALCNAAADAAEPPAAASGRSAASSPASKHAIDHSGRKRVGKASFYSGRFAGKTMANGEPMDPKDDNAASKSLPLGTRARVTNLENGRSATVTIEDRGPHVKGRILDVSPATAARLGIDREEGVATVEVAPIAVPQPDGSIKPGAGAAR
ncbi:septal ring lytic transglycosylase RlpA family protein [Ideonella sp. BN130291]|uniref:septal ring lytic transglycosylase RlpA family protein n=1 Tax=Ideonella sp. BN130291 TaxID=3112940 RepID=UPI002E25D555|nr:septal ring lytic transglycosylase RlpA family protein [Ideonella sp. BN130291]